MSEKGGSSPAEFARSLQPERHCALIYESDALAREIEFGFIDVGLAKGERCFYLTHSDEETSAIEEKMREHRDLKNAMTKGKLVTYRDTFVPGSSVEVPALFEERLKRMRKGHDGPYRVVGAAIPEITTAEQIAVQAEIDAITQKVISGSSMTVLCSFPTEKVPKNLQNEWFLRVILNHHSAIFAPRKGEGVAFDMR